MQILAGAFGALHIVEVVLAIEVISVRLREMSSGDRRLLSAPWRSEGSVANRFHGG